MSQAVVKYRMNVAGVVQGVGFRYMTKILADELGINGTVKNEMDGSVTIEAVGNYQDMSLFIERVKASPAPYGRVDKLPPTHLCRCRRILRFLSLFSPYH
ncbi:acylphosphatase [Enterococcus cecorum]|uniref:acylphosphatase n=1 Tax=Enterococcus cecorum TaxID=44008 RepID=UPI001FABB625|nr:acylphosphatase [Enterococcus cecorum]MCJ0562862.1 acylphosphatase [Enterococcus cecorum]